jgi:hypothetical protein
VAVNGTEVVYRHSDEYEFVPVLVAHPVFFVVGGIVCVPSHEYP